MTRVSEPLPKPDEHGLDVSHRLGELIRAELRANDGWMGFERYMQFALYEPELGYYTMGVESLVLVVISLPRRSYRVSSLKASLRRFLGYLPNYTIR